MLHGLDLDVPAGQRVAVVGPSGCGKTTLAMVLLRFLDPAAGTVTIGGTDITALESDTVRRIIGLCAQDAHIFDSTLEANLRLARPDASPAELRGALAQARLLDWVDSLPGGLATPVGEHGAQLSGGQRQRLALARVLLADFPVVILDEPAEHLDDDTARALTRDLLAATEGRTRLLITHRPVDARRRRPDRPAGRRGRQLTWRYGATNGSRGTGLGPYRPAGRRRVMNVSRREKSVRREGESR